MSKFKVKYITALVIFNCSTLCLLDKCIVREGLTPQTTRPNSPYMATFRIFSGHSVFTLLKIIGVPSADNGLLVVCTIPE